MSEASSKRGQVREDVLDHLENYAATPPRRDGAGDVLLSDCGLDSLGTFEFILSLEDRFRVTIRDEDLNARRLRSVNGVVDLLVAIYERERVSTSG